MGDNLECDKGDLNYFRGDNLECDKGDLNYFKGDNCNVIKEI